MSRSNRCPASLKSFIGRELIPPERLLRALLL